MWRATPERAEYVSTCRMSAGGAFGGARGYQPKPPEKGVFPLDHFGECKSLKEAYLDCLRKNSHKADACHTLSRRYLECRMERNLMAPQDLKELGFQEVGSQNIPKPPQQQTDETNWQERKQRGFTAGIRR